VTAATVLLVVVAAAVTAGLLMSWITIQLANDQPHPWVPVFPAGPVRREAEPGQRIRGCDIAEAYWPGPPVRPMWMAVAA
jgi:hypothetical protein